MRSKDRKGPVFLEDGTLGIEATNWDKGLTSLPLSLDIDPLHLSYPLPRYYVHRKLSDQVELICAEAALHSDLYNGLFFTDDRAPQKKPSQVAQTQEALVPQNTSRSESEKQQGVKKPKPFKRTLRGDTKQASLKQEVTEQQATSELEPADLKKGKSRSEPTTEDSASRGEPITFHGLIGNLPDFKRDTCLNCDKHRIIFSFGGCNSRRNSQQNSCAECLRKCLGNHKFLSLFDTQQQWSYKPYSEILDSKPWTSLRDYVVHLKQPPTDLPLLSLNFLLGEKKHRIQKKLNKMVQVSEWARLAQDLETVLLCSRFVEESIATLLRSEHLLRIHSFEIKLNAMAAPERKYFEGQIKRVESSLRSLLEEFRWVHKTKKKLESTPPEPLPRDASHQAFCFEEEPTLGKREPLPKESGLFIDAEDPVDEGFGITPFSFEFITSHF